MEHKEEWLESELSKTEVLGLYFTTCKLLHLNNNNNNNMDITDRFHSLCLFTHLSHNTYFLVVKVIRLILYCT